MNKKIYPHTYQDKGNNHPGFFSNFVISLLCHLLFFVILFFAPGYAIDRNPSLSVINVSLVTLPSPVKASSPAPLKTQAAVQKKEKKEAISTKTTPKPQKKSQESISLNPKKKKVKRSLKKKTFKPEKLVKSAINRIQKNVEEARPDQINKALARLKDQVDKTGPQHKDANETGPPGGTPGGKKDWDIMDIYMVEIQYRIQKNWSFTEQLAGGRTDLEAWPAIKIMANGEIKDIWFDKRSGNSYFDEQAKKAILKSNPLPPLPKGYWRPYFEVGFHFTASGLSQ
jgi:colicin import membrane protein